MKVYFVTKSTFPYGMAPTNRIQCYAKAILSQGVECKVLVYLRSEGSIISRGNTKGEGVFEGIPFEYMGKSSCRDENFIKRNAIKVFDKIRLLWFLRKNLNVGDVIFYYAPYDLLWTDIIIRIAHYKKAFFVRELCELPHGTTFETKILKLKRKIVFNHQFPQFDGVVSISDALLDLAKKYAGKYTKHIKIPILVDYEKFAIPDLSEDADTFFIFHAGSLYEQKDGFVGMIEAFGMACKRLKHNIKFISTGNLSNSPHAVEIKQIIEKYGIEGDVKFTGYLNNEELRDYLSKASVVIINKYKTQQNKYCFSTKLAEYMAASKAIIITRFGEALNWLEEKKNALIVEPHDSNQLADSIVLLYENDNLRKQIGKEGNLLCQKSFRYEVYGVKLVDFFKSLSR